MMAPMDPTRSGRRRLRQAGLLALLPGVLLVAGCPGNNPFAIPGAKPPPVMLSVVDLAAQLGMTVTQCTSTQAELRGGTNNVTLFASNTGGRVYVNAKELPPSGEIIQGQPGYQPQLSSDWVPAIRKRLGIVGPPPKFSPRPSTPNVRLPGPPLGSVVVDAGHGGRQPGAISVYKDQEKAITLAIASTVASRLQEANVRVFTTRNSDKTVSLEERTAIANTNMPDLFLAIHADSRDGARAALARGYTVLVPQRPSPPSHAAAEAIDKRLAAVSAERRGVRTDSRNVHVLRETRCPAVLVETGFLSNPYDASLLADRHYRDKLADAITQGVLDYLKSIKR